MKQLIRKILKEQDEIINVPDIHDFFDGDWNEILRFTKGKKFRIYNDINLGRVCPDNLNRIISIHGDLLISHCDNLYINRTPIVKMYSEEEIRQMVEVKGLIYF